MAKQTEVRQQWRERVVAQEASGLSVRVYCREHDLGEHSFYSWRQRLRRETEPVSFALIEPKQAEEKGGRGTAELILAGGERLRIACEEAALRVVFRALR